jgi:putative restriction endonuclease
MQKNQRLWTRDELVLALNLYLKLPFGKLDSRTPDIIHLANIIGRNANAVSMRLNNFASVDPFHMKRGIKGLEGGKKQVQPIWDEFVNNKEELLFESERILVKMENTSIENKYDEILRGTEHLTGKYRIQEVKTRVNQDVFRKIVLANYDYKCAITGIDIIQILKASQIIPWSKNEKERLNPENGICFSPLYDCAFDKGLIGINKSLEIILSSYIKGKSKMDYYSKYFSEIEGLKILKPKKYLPNADFLEYHLDVIFKS